VFIQAALLIGQMWLGEITRQRPKKISFEEFQQSNGPSEIRPIPYIAGTVEVTPMRIWYGDFTQRAVERDSHWSDYLWAGLSAALLDFITVAYRYYCAECFALGYGPDVHVERLTIGERLCFQATPGTDNAGGGFLVDDPQAWGGDQPPGEGGQYAWYDITRGNYTDPTNAYLESQLTTAPNKTPSLRGISLLIARGRLTEDSPAGFEESGYFAAGGVGFIPRFKELKAVLRRQPNNLATPFSKVGRHANPMEVWYEHSISNEFGAKAPIEELNIASLQAAAQVLHEENHGWSGSITNPTSPRDVCRNILEQIDAVADPSPSLGLTIRLIRRDYSFGSLPVLNRDVIARVDRFSPGTYEDTVNKIIVPFPDPDNNFTDRPGIYVDPANQMIQGGRIVPRTQQYLGVGDYATANLLATRDGRALSVPRATLECAVKPEFGKLRSLGDVVKFEWAQPTLNLVMRITSLTPPSPRETDWRLELIEDQFATGARTISDPGETEHIDPGAALNTAPPSASWDTAMNPPDGLTTVVIISNGGALQTHINGRIIFGAYAAGGQYARVYVTEPGGAQTLSPLQLPPDDNNKQQFNWPALAEGEYEFCIQTYSLRGATNGTKVCASIEVVFSDSAATGSFNTPAIQFSGTGTVEWAGSGSFNIP
jgi:hypothetical protein